MKRKFEVFVGNSFIKSFLLAISTILLSHSVSASEIKCEYGKEGTCPEGQFCINADKGKAICKPHYSDVQPIGFPFDSNIPIWCDQGDLTPSGNSHTWVNTAFALDLHSKRPKKPNIPVIAVISGKVIAYGGCKTENDQCGLGFGNQVKILNDDGRMAFYAHLDGVVVKTGDVVKIGDRIGTEGMTGWTGKGNPHLHFSMHENWKTNDFEYWKQNGYLPPSIPFKLTYCENGCKGNCKKIELDSRDIPCRRMSGDVTAMCKAN